jgi:glycosyltransferase involved in cell wall biosynthesis
VQHKGGLHLPDQIRQEVLSLLQNDERARIYGCLGHPTVQALDYYYAISGARIGVSINADNSVPLYHSDRFTHYTACGTMVLAKRVPDTERLMEDKKHVVYFDTASECMELINWYLGHEDERKKIADAGMQRCHTYFNPTRIAGYILELVERGRYEAPWGVFE